MRKKQIHIRSLTFIWQDSGFKTIGLEMTKYIILMHKLADSLWLPLAKLKIQSSVRSALNGSDQRPLK
jgi:hypothetical protein